jgi:tetratricopeptide (TPR) repeat protein
MPRRDAEQLARRHGAAIVRDPSRATMLIVGEDELPISDGDDAADDALSAEVRAAAERGDIEILSETQFWQRLGLVDGQYNVRRLYTPAMLADLVGVPVALVRRWHRRGLIAPARQIHRLAYFDFQEVASARRLAELLAHGVSPQEIERKLSQLARLLPHIERPLAQLPLIVEGRDLLLRAGEALVDSQGQQRLDFAATEESWALSDNLAVALPLDPRLRLRAAEPSTELGAVLDPDELLESALALEDEGRLDEAAEVYRTLLVAAGPNAEACFHLAEVLVRLGDLSAARERYSMAVELDEYFVEARCNLGCVLAELGDLALAAAAFEGALAVHADYPDAHYHLARTLDELGQRGAAAEHWRQFLAIMPDSPWADEARQRLADL